jgi:hypothetical protein
MRADQTGGGFPGFCAPTFDAEAAEPLCRYVDNDAGLLRKILVANPARLHDFDG